MYFLQSLLFLLTPAAFIYCELYGNLPPRERTSQRRKSHFVETLPQRQTPFLSRQNRFLSLFTLVQFTNQACAGATGDSGTCLTPTECAQRGGTANGPCAIGYGTCCVCCARCAPKLSSICEVAMENGVIVVATCGMTVRENGTYFVQTGYPVRYDGTGSCQITLMKSIPDVAQYRLEFEQFSIMGPEPANNICNNDQFIVSGGSPVPPICGSNMGNHMYIDAGPGITNPITLSVVTSGPSFPRNWKIKLIQIPYSTVGKADDGCLQYFTGVSGQIRSFNYDPASGLQLSNQDYSICIRTERNFCSIQYNQCADTVNNRTQSFTISGNSNSPVQSMVGSTGSGNFCQADFLIIPMATNIGRPAAPPSTVDRICGGTLSADISMTPTTIRSSAKPFRLIFHTDSVEQPADVGNKGFCLDYVQQPCTNSLV